MIALLRAGRPVPARPTPPFPPVKLLLIDGNYYVYRSFFAIRDLSNSRGERTNAIFGFIKTVRRMIKDLQPDLAAVVWDQGLPKRRTELQPAYKETRAEMPEDMRPQISFIREIAPMLGLASLSLPDTEADDLMATYACVARARGHEVVLATNDKDLFQLVDAQLKIYSTNKADLASPAEGFCLLGEDKVREKWGVPAERIGDVLALIGDTVDNIPGVDGIGPKGAAKLLAEHGSLDAILADVDAVKNERIREKLRAARGQIEQNREMVRLDLDLELPTPLEALQIAPRYPELIAALERCEFQTLLKEVRNEAAKAAAAAVPAAPSGSVQGELF